MQEQNLGVAFSIRNSFLQQFSEAVSLKTAVSSNTETCLFKIDKIESLKDLLVQKQ